MHSKVIGKCSVCEGKVLMGEPPTCCKCGAKKKEILPTIEMVAEEKQELLLG